MTDEQIVQLYLARAEEGIAQSEEKYGALLRSVIRRILPDQRDAEECLNDVWSRAWNSIPPEKPRVLSAFLARIARNLALDRYTYNRAEKRSSRSFQWAISAVLSASSQRRQWSMAAISG